MHGSQECVSYNTLLEQIVQKCTITCCVSQVFTVHIGMENHNYSIAIVTVINYIRMDICTNFDLWFTSSISIEDLK